MLQLLGKKVYVMQGNKLLLYDDRKSDVDWSSWIDTDITEDELEGLDYVRPEAIKEGSVTLQAQEDIAFATDVVSSI